MQGKIAWKKSSAKWQKALPKGFLERVKIEKW
jgi:hypothetical protein